MRSSDVSLGELWVAGIIGLAVLESLAVLVVARPPYQSLWLLPLVGGAAMAAVFVTCVLRKPGSTLAAWLIMGIISIRYQIAPAVIAAFAPYQPYGIPVDDSLIPQGIDLEVWELIVATTAYLLFRGWLRRRRSAVVRFDRWRGEGISGTTNGWAAMVAALGAATLLVPQVRQRFVFVTAPITQAARELIASYDNRFAALALLAGLARPLLAAAVLAWAHRQYKRSPAWRWPVVALGAVILPNLFYTSVSRASIALPLAAGLLCIAWAFPRERRALLGVGGGVMLLALGAVTVRKSFRGAAPTGDWFANFLSTYALGPYEYAVGLESLREFAWRATVLNLPAEFLANVPGAANYFNLTDRASQFYNWSYLDPGIEIGGGFIVPATIQGAYYWGPLLGPLFAALSWVGLAIAEDWLERNHVGFVTMMAIAFAMVVLGLYYANSVSPSVAMLASPVLPMLVIAWLQRRWSGMLSGRWR